MQRHPLEGERFGASLEAWLGDWLHTIGQHHERFDGTGYPDGLRGDEISLAGRIVAVTDAYETMTAVRSYSRPKSPVEARRELQACVGTHFDPVVVRGFTNVSIGKFRWTAGLAAWIAQIPFLGVPMRAGAQMVTSAAAAQGSAGAVSSDAPALSSDGSGISGSGSIGASVATFESTADGDSDVTVVDEDANPGQSGSTPGQSGSTPGQSGSNPGQSGSNPGNGIGNGIGIGIGIGNSGSG